MAVDRLRCWGVSLTAVGVHSGLTEVVLSILLSCFLGLVLAVGQSPWYEVDGWLRL